MKQIAGFATIAVVVLMEGVAHSPAAQESEVVEIEKSEVLRIQEDIDQATVEVGDAQEAVALLAVVATQSEEDDESAEDDEEPAAATGAAEGSTETPEAAAAESGMSPGLMIGLLLLALVLVVLAAKQLRKA